MGGDIAVRLRYVFDGPLGQIPCLLVFDDFEQGNLEEREGGYVLSSEMAQILPALLKAIRESQQHQPGHHHQPLPVPSAGRDGPSRSSRLRSHC